MKMSDDIDVRRRKALFRAEHRGTKEMDWMLGRFAAAELGKMDSDQLATFEQFLTTADPQIHAWLMAPNTCDRSEYASLIDQIRHYNNLN